MDLTSRFKATEPKLCHHDYDLSKAWFVHFTITDRLTGEACRKQFRGDINVSNSKIERLRTSKKLISYWNHKLNNGYNPMLEGDKAPSNFLLAEALDKVLEIKGRLRKRTVETYKNNVRIFKEWLQAERLDLVTVSEFNNPLASQYLDHITVKRGYSARTHNDHLTNLSCFFNAMIDRKWIGENPFKGIKKRPETIGRNLAFTDDEREKLKEVLYEKDRRLYYFTQIMYFCFIRRQELARLRVRDIDLHNNTITIPAEISKNKRQESVVIPVGLEGIFNEMQLHRHSPDAYLFGRGLGTSFDVYTNPNHITTRHNKFVKKLDIYEEKTLYSWKHTGACRAYYATGKDIYSLMRQLRHRELNTTMIYLKSLGLVQNDVFRNSMID